MNKKQSLTLAIALLFVGCHLNGPLLKRENLFSLRLGVLENEMDVFLRNDVMPNDKNRIYMKDGIFFIANGTGSKVMQLTSYGDLLSLYYNADKNPQPVALSLKSSERSNKKAIPFPFVSPGEITVSENRTMFVQEVVDKSRQIINGKDSALKNIILKFDSNGEYSGYIGEEGLEGTPFSYIMNINMAANDTLLVLTQYDDEYRLYNYNTDGTFIKKYTMSSSLFPHKGEGVFINVEGVFPSQTDIGTLFVTLDYYKEGIEENTGASIGVSKTRSVVYNFDGITHEFDQGFVLPDFKATLKGEGLLDMQSVILPLMFLGSSLNNDLFFLTSGTHDKHTLFVYSRSGKLIAKRLIEVKDEEFYYTNFKVDASGLLYALLVDHESAHVVWWRSDNLRGN
ncbi:LIC_12708 family protein [Spirochaeta cellobiosiphila]|uniref:LIC_12708 family protein n=1 Tax=Spirochaeta cellobiosiphila TaxID=504483 RepID=UPI000404223E|nr:hypothetical protein [Spirochaeta cellobiosiphila]